MSEVDKLKISSAAQHTLNSLSRTSFKDAGLDSSVTNIISEAIANAIEEYDRQQKENK